MNPDPAEQATEAREHFVDYVHAIARGVGVCPNGNVDTIALTGQPVTSAYIALPHRPPDIPCDLALVWDHHRGWAVAIEPDTHHRPIAIAYHSHNVLPAPAEVVAFVRNLLDDRPRG